mmetsp:Transcript_13508/g.27585  ORF Transcript_13508/g.27585 Transcript_13508/m.27585 type:complete len:209 (+) Transcript_13508:1195-1821(+)
MVRVVRFRASARVRRGTRLQIVMWNAPAAMNRLARIRRGVATSIQTNKPPSASVLKVFGAPPAPRSALRTRVDMSARTEGSATRTLAHVIVTQDSTGLTARWSVLAGITAVQDAAETEFVALGQAPRSRTRRATTCRLGTARATLVSRALLAQKSTASTIATATDFARTEPATVRRGGRGNFAGCPLAVTRACLTFHSMRVRSSPPKT